MFLYVLCYLLFYLGQLSHFLSWFCAGVTNLNEPPSSFLLPPHYCRLGAGSIPLRAIVNKKAMRDQGVIYVAGHWLLNRRCTRLPGCICLYCVGWGIKLYSLTQGSLFGVVLNKLWTLMQWWTLSDRPLSWTGLHWSTDSRPLHGLVRSQCCGWEAQWMLAVGG